MSRGAQKSYTCKNCGGDFIARVADRARGWALYCSKSCKAKNSLNGRRAFASFQHRELGIDYISDPVEDSFHPHDSYSLGQE